ncbi:NAD(P)H-dependent flavin oxidoreductase [Hufsiella ginkgonis]|uniref:Nitronate monooxygenase n=1 Tax=Hufsiella ginkgonis TaxID=2695274 RepID=A0A7K1Y3T0_9SPHI|nr:nitronate monooxygenase [Hufsiella ginkgonis]MXV17935.1 nitronate monooxygenase [Hufsiella ginkgonis]
MPITSLFNVRYPIVQAGMVWCSGWKLASAVSNAGGLGLIGAGSMYPDNLRNHIRKCAAATAKPFGVNVPLLYPDVKQLIDIIVEESVRIVFTSAGNPAAWTGYLKDRGITVVHVVASQKYAKRAEAAGADAVVAEGFEAGGHNGREETTTLCLIPMVTDVVSVPVIAAGGIASGKAMLAAFALGAEGVQVGSLFAAAEESSAHPLFKEAVVRSGEGDTRLSMKGLMPVRLLRNDFSREVDQADRRGASAEELRALLGTGRAKLGMFEGDLQNGELEIGQAAALVNQVKPAATIVNDLWNGFLHEKTRIASLPAELITDN